MHALPALTDACQEFPGIEFDWIVDETFAEVPSWHPSVKNIYTSAHRRWKKTFWKSLADGEFKKFYRQINLNNYDCIIDAQNNVKSSFISFLRRGSIHGMDRESVAEQPAWLAYRYKHCIDRKNHAIARQRELFARALSYRLPETIPEYGLKNDAFRLPDIQIKNPFLVLVHNASWSTKLLPEKYWHDVIKLAETAGYDVLLPGGNKEELERAQRIANSHDNAISLPKMTLSEIGGLLKEARGAICCDTGLAHLSAMTGTPAVTLYGPTSADLIGTTGSNQSWITASKPPYTCAPCYKRVCNFENRKTKMSSCMHSFTPEKVWQKLEAKLMG